MSKNKNALSTDTLEEYFLEASNLYLHILAAYVIRLFVIPKLSYCRHWLTTMASKNNPHFCKRSLIDRHMARVSHNTDSKPSYHVHVFFLLKLGLESSLSEIAYLFT